MLRIVVPKQELWDEINNVFITTKEQTLVLEHSLVSLSKWESKWCKPFLTEREKTLEETIDYIRCMTLTQNVDPNIYRSLTTENLRQINEYIEAPMTASWVRETSSKTSNEQLTSELIYYYMTDFHIPFECQKWHLNRLMMLIKICNAKRQPPKKMSRGEILRRNAALNAERKKKYNTRG